MSASSAERLSPWPEQWAAQLAVEIGELRQQVVIVRARGLNSEQEAIAGAAETLVDVAAAAVQRRPIRRSTRVRRSRTLLDRWRGASLERAFRSLHTARIFMVDLMPEADVRAMVPARSAASFGS
jgi:hypothetical protein